MANWEKLIEEHYEKKKKELDASLIMEMIDLELENTFQSGAIEGHAGKRLSTKGTKKAGGDPFDEDPPKERSKSAPAGFGALEEESLEESNRGVAHPDKMGKVVTNKSGDELTLSSFSFLEVGDKSEVELKDKNGETVLRVGDEIEDTETLAAVANELTKGSEVLYKHPEKITKANKAVIIVFADDGKKSFIKYTKNSPFWKEKEFTLKTGYAFSGTQSTKEILDVGPDLFINPSKIRPVTQLPSALSSDVLNKIGDNKLAKSLIEYLKAAVGGSGQLPLLKFDSEDSRKKYLPSIYKYFSEVMGPIFLATKNASFLTGPIDEAEKALLNPFGIKGFAANEGIYYPTSKTEKLKDSVLAFDSSLGEQEVHVSSKAKSGANPSLAELYKGLNSLPEKDKAALAKEFGPSNALNIYNNGEEGALGIIEILADPKYTYATMPFEAAKSLGFPQPVAKWDDAKELMVTVAKNGWKPKAWQEIVKANPQVVQALRKYKKNLNADTTKPNYSEARHILAGLAIEVQNTVNKSGEVTRFAKAMYNRFPLVQIYAKQGAYKPVTTEDGTPALKSAPLKLIYPAQFNGEMFIDAQKNYFATGNKGKMTIKIVY